ncbi:hypothetical protein [Fibrobacter sp.]|uniref:hypothetical protein n=1 Tax=Fibrobacter sp. TaxID=35828 RepID=UPI00386EBA3A
MAVPRLSRQSAYPLVRLGTDPVDLRQLLQGRHEALRAVALAESAPVRLPSVPYRHIVHRPVNRALNHHASGMHGKLVLLGVVAEEPSEAVAFGLCGELRAWVVGACHHIKIFKFSPFEGSANQSFSHPNTAL